MISVFSSVWRYKYFIASSIKRELVGQFARSKFGGMWAVVHPLVMVAIYAFVLSSVLSAKFDGVDNKYAYAIYLTAGILGWTLFSEIVTKCVSVFVKNGNLLKKMAIPKVALPAITVGSALINNLLMLLAIILIFLMLGHFPWHSLSWLIIVTICVSVFAVGVGTALGVLNVFFRDIEQVVPIVLQLLFWLTPIVYPKTIIPQEYWTYVEANPIYSVVSAYHSVLVFNEAPDLNALLNLFMVSMAICLFAFVLLRKARQDLVDFL